VVAIGGNWKCPYCGHAQVIAQERRRADWARLSLNGWKKGRPAVGYELIACANAECLELSLAVFLATWVTKANGDWTIAELTNTWALLPESSARPQPDYIPEALRQDYYEACRIRELSPKASATLARRCLQGMIRDFCKIAKATLDAEIRALRTALDEGAAPAGVTLESVDGIDHVRSLGNIGAHMEKDVNLIIDIDPGEAQALIELIEVLFVEWYVARQQRLDRFAKVAAIGAQKKQERDAAKAIASGEGPAAPKEEQAD